MPGTKAIGAYTAAKVIVMAITAKLISFEPFAAAAFGFAFTAGLAATFGAGAFRATGFFTGLAGVFFLAGGLLVNLS